MNEWNLFFTATAGASAVLTGLVFVGVSINLTKILASPSLPNRALLSIIILLANLIFSLTFLIPNQTVFDAGIKILILVVLVWIISTRLDMRMYRKAFAEFKKVYISNFLLNQISLLLFIAGSILMVFIGNDGIYLIAGGILFSFIKAVLEAWVLLVEIDR